ncbi:MAG: hypothetical protein K2Y39_12980 [Candidatus Obscuribacterales bacterium]|nr:hypothetical protein [Candidatus Obscuribacterales bacterium]
MTFPENGSFSLNDRSVALEAANSCPLESTPMIDKRFNEVYCLTKPNQNACFLAPDSLLLNQLYDSSVGDQNEPQMCMADRHEQRGPLDVSINDQGEITKIKNQAGVTFERQPDGKFAMKDQDGKVMQTVENLKVDGLGNMQYDTIVDSKRLHVEFNVDGSFVLQDENTGRILFDKNGNVLETPSGDGLVRKYHYNGTQLVAIDGNLGHWDRVEENGQISWKNSTTGAVWQGDFAINSTTHDLEYSGAGGNSWAFTTKGVDVPMAPKQQ